MTVTDSKRPLHFQSADGRFGLSFLEDAVEELLKYCREAEDVETGGIIVGRYSEDRVTAVADRVTGPPPDSKHFFAQFLRGVQGLQELLNCVWSKRERQFYLGEWHYHPLPNPVPSADDIAQMREIANSKKYACPEPLLHVVDVKIVSLADSCRRGVSESLSREARISLSRRILDRPEAEADADTPGGTALV